VGHDPDTVPVTSFLARRAEVLAAGRSSADADISLVDASLNDDDPFIRVTALGALSAQGRLTGDALIAALNDEAPEVRLRAAQLAPKAVGRGSRRRLAEELRSRLTDPVPICVVAVLVAIADRHDHGAAEALCALAATHRDPLVVEEAVATLGALGDEIGLDTVLAATTGKPALRRRAVAALGGFSGPRVEESLDRLADDRDWQVRQAVAMLRRGDDPDG